MSETITATETTTATSPDISITKTERFNNTRLAQLLQNPDLTAEDKRSLRGIKNGTRNLCYFDATYKLGRSAKQEQLGRYCVVQGLGAQTLSRDIRAALYGEYYHDVDIVNAQPNILLQYCTKNGWVANVLRQYCDQRDTHIQRVCEVLDCDRNAAKQRIVSILFGGSADGLPFLAELADELRIIRQNVWTANKSRLHYLARHSNYMGRALALILQTEEAKCLLAIDTAFGKQGRSMDVLIHDGGLVARKADEETIDEALLRQVEADVAARTGYTISLAVKPMQTTIVFTDAADEYAAWKAEFEQAHFSIEIPQCFVWVHERGNELLTAQQLAHLVGSQKMSNGKSFLSKWLDDETKLTYNRLAFAPKKAVPEGCYNIFSQFENVPAEEDGDISAYKEMLGIVSNHDAAVADYLENLFAHMLQKPYEKSGVAVCIQGDQGAGKDTLLGSVGKIFGRGYYYNTSTPENDVFHTFNSGTERCIMIKFEEADFKTNKSNQSKLKSIITSETETYRKKGHDTIELNDYRNFFMTTNADLPFVIEPTDRRFVLLKASNEKCRDTDYFNRIYPLLEDQRSAYHRFLLNRDITQFNPRRDRPITQAYNDAQQMTAIPPLATYFQSYLSAMADDPRTMTWTATDLRENAIAMLRTERGDNYSINQKRFGMWMRDDFVDSEARPTGIHKQEGGSTNRYTISPLLLRDYLQSRGWWVDM